jgi:hypothetical protein
MEHIAAFLLIVGCTGGTADCRELSAPTPVFETVEDCEDLRQPTIGAYASRYKRVLGVCVAVDPAEEDEDATIVWSITPAGRLEATLERNGFTVAADFQRREKGLVRQH